MTGIPTNVGRFTRYSKQNRDYGALERMQGGSLQPPGAATEAATGHDVTVPIRK